jgi:hypothetical protein
VAAHVTFLGLSRIYVNPAEPGNRARKPIQNATSLSVRDAIDLTVEGLGGSRDNPIDLSADNAENQAMEANHNVQITQRELKILQEEVFEKRESTHRKITKMTTKRLEKLLKQVENGEQVEAKDDSEFHVDEGTGEYQNLKPIYVANVGEDIKSIAMAAYKTTSNAGGSMAAGKWMYQELVRFCKECSCNFPAAYSALLFCRFEWDAAVKTFPNGARSDEM